MSADEAFRVLLVHHPLHSGSRLKRLTNSKALRAVLKRRGVELVLHGHDHIHSTMWIEGADRQIPAVGVPSASALAHRHYPAAAYNLFSISRDGDKWRCVQTVRAIGDRLPHQQITQRLGTLLRPLIPAAAASTAAIAPPPPSPPPSPPWLLASLPVSPNPSELPSNEVSAKSPPQYAAPLPFFRSSSQSG